MLRPGSGSSKRTFARGGLTSIKDWIRLQRTFPQGYDGTVQQVCMRFGCVTRAYRGGGVHVPIQLEKRSSELDGVVEFSN
ncbi:hypothetical protein SCLCIDRAFT_1218998 [Scleroderma citrinum Foug A]|uniref:Uncharacterized protein n=1 Tax=Scleroderma citrinum Foug A TaxID=1036808 RepID=A0A0C2ZZT4_9AGAM|nr:hypothetical protein SCLCIDRAFT_1218998 [Scleroderma citrinum Foug A]